MNTSAEPLQITKPDRRIFPGWNVVVTDRPYQEVLNDVLGLSVSQIKGSRLLSIGEGMSDFAHTCNVAGLCEAVAIDPIYSLVAASKTLSSYERECAKQRITSLQTKDRFRQIKSDIVSGTHLPFFSYDDLPFDNESFDIAVAPMVVDLIQQDAFAADFYKRFDEIARIVKKDGYICCGKDVYTSENYPLTLDAFQVLADKGWVQYVQGDNKSSWLFLSRGDIRKHKGMENILQKKKQ